MSFETVVFVVSYLIQAIECLYVRSCHLRLLCLWCHISFRRSSVYTHRHVIWDCCVCGVISHSGDRVFIRTVMSFETVVFVVSYLIQAIERLYAQSWCLRLLCLWHHFSFRRSSIYTHGHNVWDCCVCGIVSHSGNCAAAGYAVWDATFYHTLWVS